MDVAAFWMGLAAVVVAWFWRRNHTEAMRHQTLRTMLDRKETIDEKLVNDVLNPPVAESRWSRVSIPGESSRVFRFLGSLFMLLSPAAGIFGGIMTYFESREPEMNIVIPVGIGIALIIFVFGLALFVSARFLSQPANRNEVA